MFFARIQTIYGVGRCKTLFEDQDELRLMRREWAKALGEFSMEQLETIFTRLKSRLAAGDSEYRFPDVARILELAHDKAEAAAHRVFPIGLPEPDWRRAQRIETGRLASKTCVAVMDGRACFVEDRPNAES